MPRIIWLTIALLCSNVLPAEAGCPQKTDGWLLYDDSSKKVPDFFWEDSVEIREMLICGHGVHLYFVSTSRGQVYYTSLAIVNPTLDFYFERVEGGMPPAERGWSSPEEWVEKTAERYQKLRQTLKQWLGDSFAEHAPIDFKDVPGRRRPNLHPSRGLTMMWGKEEIRIRGYLDVYFNKIL